MTDLNVSTSPDTPSLTTFDAVLFDLDGVITPTARVHEQAWREVFEEVLPLVATGDRTTYREDDYHLYIDGRSRYEGVSALLTAHEVALPYGSPSADPGVESVCAIGNKKNAVFAEILHRDAIEPYPDAVGLMSHLRQAGVAMALVSSSANADAVLTAAGLGGAFGVVVDGNVIAREGLRGKPHPDPFLEAARLLGVEPEACVVIEDAISGVEAGRAGDFGLVVGVARDGDEGRLVTAGADIVVTDLEGLS